MKVVQTEPTLQKATASGGHEARYTETGLGCKVPPVVMKGDRIKSGHLEARYVQRVD